jgi:15-cis-phytoene synthase
LDALSTAIPISSHSASLAAPRPLEVSAFPATVTTSIVPALAGVSQERLESAYAQCAKVVRSRARNFYYGLRLTPEPRRSAIYSIYAWMRAADDEADAETLPAERQRRLAAFRERTEEILRGRAMAHGEPSFWTAFAATAASYPVDRTLFFHMLDGLSEDLSHAGYETEADLRRYCYRVASTVGLVCISIWGTAAGTDPARIRELAERRGQAFQLTNILRDFAEDHDSVPSRVYLPRTSFAEASLTPADVRTWSDASRCDAFIRKHALAARSDYVASEGLERLIDPACAPTLWAMTRIYSGILELIEKEPGRIVQNRRVRLPSARKARIALAASWRAKRGSW